ncbi:hypothetical protein ACSMXN_09395 [Jatrophihabitans sp. DSM 45814]
MTAETIPAVLEHVVIEEDPAILIARLRVAAARLHPDNFDRTPTPIQYIAMALTVELTTLSLMMGNEAHVLAATAIYDAPGRW